MNVILFMLMLSKLGIILRPDFPMLMRSKLEKNQEVVNKKKKILETSMLFLFYQNSCKLK